MENNQGQGVGSYSRKNNNGKGTRGGEEGKDAARELRKKTITRRTAAEDVKQSADDFMKMENNNQGVSKSKVGSYRKINNGKAGVEEGKDTAGELRRKTITRQIASEDVNELADDFKNMENNKGASKTKVGSYMQINNGKGGTGSEAGKDIAGELRNKTITRQRAAEDVNELDDDFIKMENNNQGASNSKVGSYRKVNNGKGGGSKEGKDDAGELRKKTIVRQIAAEDVNELADDFIKNFRKQLKIERADSIKRFREMIDRGA